jgi:ankyrin repeat protein
MTTLARMIDAIQAGDERTVKQCLMSGVDPNGVEDEAHVTPLHFAVFYERRTIVQLLLFWGANPHARDRLLNETPMELQEQVDAEQE